MSRVAWKGEEEAKGEREGSLSLDAVEGAPVGCRVASSSSDRPWVAVVRFGRQLKAAAEGLLRKCSVGSRGLGAARGKR